MRFRSALPVLAALTCLMVTTDALAMLNTALGRFMHRDPLGYVDGMNQYAAFHVMHGGLDPSGLWTDPQRKGGFYAQTMSDSSSGDTIAELAENVGLDAAEFQQWLSVDSRAKQVAVLNGLGGESVIPLSELNQEHKICPGQEFYVPNVILMIVDADPTNGVERIIDNLIGQIMQGQGYKVLHDSDSSVKDLLNLIGKASELRLLHGIYLQAHGGCSGWYQYTNGRGDGGRNEVTYESMMKSMNYSLGWAYLSVCEGGWRTSDNPKKPSPNWGYDDVDPLRGQYPGSRYVPSDKPTIGAGGGDLVSDNAYDDPNRFHGRKSTYVSVLDDRNPIFDAGMTEEDRRSIWE